MVSPINIHDNSQQIYLSVGIYSVKVIGGWGVKVNDFSILLKKVENDITIKSESTIWRYQSYAFNQRAKRILVLDVYQSGNYIVEFKNPKSLQVRRSSLFISRFIENPIPNGSLEICINC